MLSEKMRNWLRVRPGYWFRPKLYGYGATPVTWQGWAVTGGFAAVMIKLALDAAREPLVLLLIPLLVLGLVVIARRMTDGEWRWRWGTD